jgi:GntR family transcriptional regulator
MSKIELFKQYPLDKSALVPLYFQIKNVFKDMLNRGYLEPGDMIPTEYELCSTFNISRTTIRQALTELVEEGFFYRVKGRGTFVSQNKLCHNLLEEKALFSHGLINKGIQPITVVIEHKIIQAPVDVANALQIPTSSQVLSIKRLRYANGDPIYINQTYLPYHLCKSILDHNLNEASLCMLLSKNIHTRLAQTRYSFEAVTATKEDCELLEISKITAIQLINSISYNKFNVPVKHTTCRYRGDKNVFTLEQIHE